MSKPIKYPLNEVFAWDNLHARLHNVEWFIENDDGIVDKVQLLPNHYQFPLHTYTYFYHYLN